MIVLNDASLDSELHSPADYTVTDSALVGDVNGDGLVSFIDIQPFIDALTSPEFVVAADINFDGEVNFFDIAPFIAVLAG